MKTDLGQQRVNYDEIAHLYDEPLRDHGVDENLVTFLAERPLLNPTQMRILDMGCGTGKQLAANSTPFPDLPMFGMDLFLGMVKQAKKRNETAFWVTADNMAAPFAANTFQYITNQFSYAHVLDKAQFIREAYRLCAVNGRFVLTNIDPWRMPNWLIYRYFPAAQTLDYQDFLPIETLSQLFQKADFVNIQHQHQHLNSVQTLADFYNYALQRYRASEFMAISDTAYAQGLQNIESDLKVLGPEKKLPSQVCLLTIRGDKSGPP